MIQICSVALFLLLLAMKQEACKKDERDEYDQTEKGHFLKMNTCSSPTLNHLALYVKNNRLSVLYLLKWFCILLKAKECKMVKKLILAPKIYTSL